MLRSAAKMASRVALVERASLGRITRQQAQQHGLPAAAAMTKRSRSLSPAFRAGRAGAASAHMSATQHHTMAAGNLFLGAELAQRERKQARLMASRAAGPHASVSYTKQAQGTNPSLEYRVFVKDGAKVVSPWHDIPLSAGNGAYNMVVEIPKETKAKMEVATDEASTPIKQDTKKGKLRDYPYNINWNYGMLPQTWEDPNIKSEACGGVSGDNDPVDVVEIGGKQHATGEIVQVKPLGVYAMVDDGELDWKVIAIDVTDPKAALVNDVADVEKVFPGELERIRVWFRDYKIPDGKPANKFALEDKCMPKAYTLKIIEETHENYVKLKTGKTANGGGLSLH